MSSKSLWNYITGQGWFVECIMCSGLKNVHDRHAAVVETCFGLVHNRESAKKERDETVWNLSRPKKLWHCQRPFSLCRPLLLFHRCSKLSHIGRVHPIPYSCTNVQKWLRDISLERGRRGGGLNYRGCSSITSMYVLTCLHHWLDKKGHTHPLSATSFSVMWCQVKV